MKTFGYAKKKLSPQGLLEMREITFTGSAASIRDVAAFFLAAAEEMERRGHQFSHMHIGEQCSNWLKKWPDIVVSR
jgi:hypothetical protein